MSIGIKELDLVQESASLEPKIGRIIEILLASVNDWPRSISTIEDYEIEVRQFLGNEILEQNIRQCLKRIDLGKSAWEAESLSQLLEVFEFYREGSAFRDIIRHITTSLRKA
jgi:hypothetical protein